MLRINKKIQPMLTDAEVERRKPVWTALSEFWLDTELDDNDLRRIARAAAASGYSVSELRDIYLYEIAPIVGPNLLPFGIQGEWVGFDEQWLHTIARLRAERRARRRGRRFGFLLRMMLKTMTYATEDNWHRMVALLPTVDAHESENT
ncbi:MAG: hypothetical protein LBV29_01400 [Azoarcus sp.]|nr:hypothetical protein [Azoarcus sp.]